MRIQFIGLQGYDLGMMELVNVWTHTGASGTDAEGNGTRNCKFCQLFRVAVKWGPLFPRWGVCEGTLVNKQYKK